MNMLPQDKMRASLAALNTLGSFHLFALVFLFSTRTCTANMILHALYSFQVVIRSFFPSEYFHQRVVRESLASSILMARILASIGETAFAFLVGSFFVSKRGASPSFALNLTLICALAQCCATAGTIFKKRKLFVAEGVIWAFIFVLLFKIEADSNNKGAAGWLALVVAYIVMFYVPMCVKACGEEAKPPSHLDKDKSMSLKRKIYISAFHVTPSISYEDWKSEFSWQIPYFALGPLVSLCIIIAATP